MLPTQYTPSDWYWIVAGSTTQVYASARATYVPVSDATYQAWLAKGNMPTKIASEQDLWDVLSSAGVALPAGAAISDAEKTNQLSASDQVAFKVMFNHENRIRALESKAAITAAQFAAAVKALL